MNIYELNLKIDGMRHVYWYSSMHKIRKALEHYCPGVSLLVLEYDLTQFSRWHPGRFPRVARHTIDIPLE